jgi:hypothetical protein
VYRNVESIFAANYSNSFKIYSSVTDLLFITGDAVAPTIYGKPSLSYYFVGM